MADSLLYALLEHSDNFTSAQFDLLLEEKKRLLRSELYEALMRDQDIMPTLIRAILQQQRKAADPTNEAQQLFQKLAARIHADFQQIPH